MPGIVSLFLFFLFFFLSPSLAIKVFLEERDLFIQGKCKAQYIKAPILARTSKGYYITASDLLSSGLLCTFCEQYVNYSIAELEIFVILLWGIFSLLPPTVSRLPALFSLSAACAS